MSGGPWTRRNDRIEPTLVLIAVAALLLAVIGLVQLAASPSRSSVPPVVIRPATAVDPFETSDAIDDGDTSRSASPLPTSSRDVTEPSEHLEPVADPPPPGRPANAREPDVEHRDPNPAHH